MSTSHPAFDTSDNSQPMQLVSENLPSQSDNKKRKEKRGIKRKLESIEDVLFNELKQKNVKFLKEFLSKEYNISAESLGKQEIIGRLVTRICLSLTDESESSDDDEDELKRKALSIIEKNETLFQSNNKKQIVKKENTDDEIVLLGFKNVTKSGYTQKSREEQISLVESFKKEYPIPTHGAQKEFAMQNNISPSQFSRYLSAYNKGKLSVTVERGHPPPLLLHDQIVKVIAIIEEEMKEKAVSNRRIGEIIKQVAQLTKTPSACYSSAFAKKFLKVYKTPTSDQPESDDDTVVTQSADQIH